MESVMTRHDSVVGDMVEIAKDLKKPVVGLFSLPAEIRTHIYELVFDVEETYADAFKKHHPNEAPNETPNEIWEGYTASSYLAPILTCRQFYNDAQLLAFSRTLFVVTNPYIGLDIRNRLCDRLRPDQIQSLRHIAFVADSRHFRKVCHWKNYPFGQPLLCLTELTVILHRSSYWHYLFDFNTALVTLLRNLQGVDRLTFVRNNALVKGTLLTWYNRFVKLILKIDHQERFLQAPPCPEKTWWSWEHSAEAQTVSLSCLTAKNPSLSIAQYEELVTPLHKTLVLSMELEEEDPDPMSRVSA